MDLDRNFCKAIRPEIDKALEELGDKFGVEIKAGNARYTGNQVTFKLEASLVKDDGSTFDPKRDEFSRICGRYGLQASDLDRVIETTRGQKIKIIGLNPKRRKYPVLIEDLMRGKEYIATPDQIQMYMATEKAA